MKRIFLSAILILIPFGASAQNVDILDTNLHAVIATALGKAPNATITTEEMATLRVIERHDSDISDLTGLESATNIERINFRDTLIFGVSPLSGLNKLQHLELRGSNLEDLSPIAGLTNLRVLIVTHSLIWDMTPREGLIQLEFVDVSVNDISDYSPLASLTTLRDIRMNDNPEVEDMSPFSGLMNLQRFRSWGTPIPDLSPFVELPKLIVLDICGGELSDLSELAGLTHLRELYLVGNEIDDITPLAGLTSLTRLNLRHNQVSDVEPLAALKKLTYVELTDNEILDFSPLDALPANVSIVRHDNPGFTGAPSKLRGEWLWMIVPTGNRSGADAASSGIDFLKQASGDQVTELSVASDGATLGNSVGDKVWAASWLSSSGNNLNEMANETGLAFGNVDHHVAYGLLTFDSPREQQTTMHVGSGDAVKVWLNGNLVHTQAVNRDAQDWNYQDQFPVTFKAGTNRLLTAVYEGTGW